MASIYKRTRDKRRRGAAWYVAYTDETGRRRSAKGFTDRGLTEQLAATLENEVMLRVRGLIDPALEATAVHRRKHIAKHVDDFEAALGRRGVTANHVELTMMRIRRIIALATFDKLSDIDVEGVEKCMTELRATEDLGHRTYNHYLQAFESFCRWLVEKNRLVRNPLLGIAKLNAEVDVRHRRRALTPQEIGRLVEAARTSGKKIQQYDGEGRARIYLVSFMTGLRRRELASLTPQSFELSTDPPTLKIEAACSKHRRTDVLPLHPELVAMLRSWLPRLAPDELLFPKLARKKVWFMIQKDLERAGIPYTTAEGTADFHAAGRHSYVTALLQSGASIVQAKELARHSDVRMTMKYTHVGIGDQARALAALPVPAAAPTAAKPTPRPEWQRLDSAPNGRAGQSGSSPVPAMTAEAVGNDATSPCRIATYDLASRSTSLPVATGEKRRARDSNPQPVARHLNSNQAASQFAYPPGGASSTSFSETRASRTIGIDASSATRSI